MIPRDRALWLRFQRRAGQLSPELSKALLDAFRIIRDNLTAAEIDKLLAGDDALLDRAMLRVRARVRSTVEKGFNATVTQLPKGGAINGEVAVAFDTLNPKVIDAVRTLDTRVVNALKEDVRETVRAYVENGLRDGDAPTAIARRIRSVVGLSPSQAENARKYEAKLADSGKYSAERVEKMAATYRRKAIALNAETNARTATLDSLKLGQKLSWDDAIAQGIVDPSRLKKTWITVGDDRVRDEHQAMQGESVGYDDAYSNGEYIPGESTYNCRCISRYVVRAA
jgi:uncharacterized protein with gpF-like domain